MEDYIMQQYQLDYYNNQRNNQQLNQLSFDEQIRIATEESTKLQDLPLKLRKREQGKPIGLQNLGSTCYLNCVLQILYYIPELSSLILDARPINDKEELQGLQTFFIKQFQLLIVKFWISNQKYLKPDKLFQKFQKLYNMLSKDNIQIKVGQNHDLSEILEFFLQKIDESIIQIINDPTNSKICYENETLNKLFYGKKKMNNGEIVYFQNIYLSPDQVGLIETLNYQRIFEQFVYEQLPEVLQFTLCRINQQQQKLETLFDFPLKINLDELNGDKFENINFNFSNENKETSVYNAFQDVLEYFQNKQVKNLDVIQSLKTDIKQMRTKLSRKIDINSQNKENTYDLGIIVIHKGSITSGHYYMYAKNYYKNEWYKYNDTSVEIFTNFNQILDDALKHSYKFIYFSQNQQNDIQKYQEEKQQIEKEHFQNQGKLINYHREFKYFSHITIKMIEREQKENEQFLKEIQQQQ